MKNVDGFKVTNVPSQQSFRIHLAIGMRTIVPLSETLTETP